ncbi:allophanate hydrolase subunit 1 [Spongiactinospora sp. 9N601]|uniref:allophanate hydrolase subunit 1 n=1 Tax=Spongiactinospora sp. 9N601 TaxID=3375149 RepID=UPI0037B3F4FD
MTSGADRVAGIRPAGDRAVLIELDDLDSVRRLHEELSRAHITGVADIVPGARTLLVIADRPHGTALAAAVRLARGPAAPSGGTAPPATVRLPIRYDGADLADVARRCGITVAEVIERHSRPRYTAAFLGLSPGFAYLVGLDPVLRLPRRDTPRTSVPAGAVAMASEFTGVYPRPSPGGWHLLGTVEERLWDLDRDPPALITAGVAVRFEPLA